MLSPVLEKLLILQNRDTKRMELEAQLKAVPGEIALVEQRIASEKKAIDNARDEMRHLESSKKLLETEIGSVEDKAAKYRTQQLSVKKNEEYQALGHEIETMEAQISALEERELEIMYAIDASRQRFKTAEAELKQNITGHESRIASLSERTTSLTSELAEVSAELATTREPIAARVLRLYDRISSRQMPVCVPLSGGKCGGCHLKVSSEVDSAARSKANDDELPTCDQCGRWFIWNPSFGA
jgi:uncharacterized protein